MSNHTTQQADCPIGFCLNDVPDGGFVCAPHLASAPEHLRRELEAAGRDPLPLWKARHGVLSALRKAGGER